MVIIMICCWSILEWNEALWPGTLFFFFFFADLGSVFGLRSDLGSVFGLRFSDLVWCFFLTFAYIDMVIVVGFVFWLLKICGLFHGVRQRCMVGFESGWLDGNMGSTQTLTLILMGFRKSNWTLITGWLGLLVLNVQLLRLGLIVCNRSVWQVE